MALAGMDLLQSWTGEAIVHRLRHTTDELAMIAEARGLTTIPRAFRPPHILGLLPPPGIDTPALVGALAQHGVHVADRGGQIRIGAHVFNDELDIARFSTALEVSLRAAR